MASASRRFMEQFAAIKPEDEVGLYDLMTEGIPTADLEIARKVLSTIGVRSMNLMANGKSVEISKHVAACCVGVSRAINEMAEHSRTALTASPRQPDTLMDRPIVES